MGKGCVITEIYSTLESPVCHHSSIDQIWDMFVYCICNCIRITRWSGGSMISVKKGPLCECQVLARILSHFERQIWSFHLHVYIPVLPWRVVAKRGRGISSQSATELYKYMLWSSWYNNSGILLYTIMARRTNVPFACWRCQ